MKQRDEAWRTVVKTALHDPRNDFAYWREQTPEARLTALEQIRQDYIRWKYGAEPRFQRVFAITTR